MGFLMWSGSGLRSGPSGIVVLARAGSQRIPGKALRIINGFPLIEHLIARCMATDLPVCLAIPTADVDAFEYLRERFPELSLFIGDDDDPLARLAGAAEHAGWNQVIRVCHDKIFIEPSLVHSALEAFTRKNLDYLYSSQFTPGTGFEIISRSALKLAAAKYQNIEHISYAIKNVTRDIYNFPIPSVFRSDHRLLVDYPDDLTLLNLILATLGNNCTLLDVLDFMDSNKWAGALNRLPTVSVYTCALNAEKYLQKCMGSVVEQASFGAMEYILVDDFSTDATPVLMAKMAARFPNIRYVRNPRNLGLASSSNVALSEARGKYLIRLDADDYFAGRDVIKQMVLEIEEAQADALYPNNFFGSLKKVQSGKDFHHVGGAMFSRNAVNHVKFTEMLRGYEGYDFFVRAKDQIKIAYFGKPTFFYRQRKDSMSKTNLDERARIKAEIDAKSS